ncbi:MAG: hypothetical protein QM523_04380, partial [Candidatus Pacebacteria bacterium]|nr:hypothetical protein [Candidatus Paceibacterota bacterium]
AQSDKKVSFSDLPLGSGGKALAAECGERQGGVGRDGRGAILNSLVYKYSVKNQRIKNRSGRACNWILSFIDRVFTVSQSSVSQ